MATSSSLPHCAHLVFAHLTHLYRKARCLFPAAGLVLEGRREPRPEPVIQLPGQGWRRMPREPARLARAPPMVGQADAHRWRPQRAALPQAFRRHHHVGETDPAPERPPVAQAAPGPTPGAAPEGRSQATQGAILAFPTRCLEPLPALP
jgi:hypothetical protein